MADLVRNIQKQYPCRLPQIRSLVSLLDPAFPSPRTTVIHGLPATGKTTVTRAVLRSLDCKHVWINAKAVITARQIFEEIYAGVTEAGAKTESLSVLFAKLEFALRGRTDKIIIVLDGVDEAREMSPALLAGLTRLGEILPVLSLVLIATTLSSPAFTLLHTAPHVPFPTYNKNQSIHIMSACYPLTLAARREYDNDEFEDDPFTPEDSNFLYSRYLSAVWDTYIKTCTMSLVTYKSIVTALWPTFTLPVTQDHYGPREFSKLLLHNRSLFSQDSILSPSIVVRTNTKLTLPPQLQKILAAAYIASFVQPNKDIVKFSKFHPSSKRRKGGGGGRISKQTLLSRSKTTPRVLLPPGSFTLDRLIAIMSCISAKPISSSTDLQTAISTLASLKLLIRTPAGGSGAGSDVLDAKTSYRVNVSLELARGMGRRWGMEIEEYLDF